MVRAEHIWKANDLNLSQPVAHRALDNPDGPFDALLVRDARTASSVDQPMLSFRLRCPPACASPWKLLLPRPRRFSSSSLLRSAEDPRNSVACSCSHRPSCLFRPGALWSGSESIVIPATPSARSTPTCPSTESGCSEMDLFVPPIRALAPTPMPSAISPLAPTKRPVNAVRCILLEDARTPHAMTPPAVTPRSRPMRLMTPL